MSLFASFKVTILILRSMFSTLPPSWLKRFNACTKGLCTQLDPVQVSSSTTSLQILCHYTYAFHLLSTWYKWIYLCFLMPLVSDMLHMWKHTPLFSKCWATSLTQTLDSCSDGAELLFCVVSRMVVLGPSWQAWSSASQMDKASSHYLVTDLQGAQTTLDVWVNEGNT